MRKSLNACLMGWSCLEWKLMARMTACFRASEKDGAMTTDTGQRFGVRVGKGTVLRFTRYPVETPPAEGTIAMVDNGTKDRTGSRSSAARYRDGKFRGLSFVPTFWMVLDE